VEWVIQIQNIQINAATTKQKQHRNKMTKPQTNTFCYFKFCIHPSRETPKTQASISENVFNGAEYAWPLFSETFVTNDEWVTVFEYQFLSHGHFIGFIRCRIPQNFGLPFKMQILENTTRWTFLTPHSTTFKSNGTALP